MNRYVCIHGHFYQPSRENPWLEAIELQDAAYPYHDWNERITEECYAPNTAARILDAEKKIIDIVNNYTKISFDFGPTLLGWLERFKPEIYQAILLADREGQSKFSGHGPAIAQIYNHIIMPLANIRDKRTQVIWGIKDFKYRFKRLPEGMWLPETAVDLDTLDILAEEGIKFTILAPHQAKRVRKIGENEWQDVNNGKIDIKMPYLCKLPSGKTIHIFFYNKPISQDIAFGGLLNSGEMFAKELLKPFAQQTQTAQLVHIATDGETYGHHHRFGDMALAYCLYYIESNNLAQITIYGEYLEKHPPTHEVEIVENSSWSCAHGIERWRDNCGCNTGAHPGWTQAWRAPLRRAMDWLRDALIKVYQAQISLYVKDVWQVRDDYIEVILDRSPENVENFFSIHLIKEITKQEKIKVLKLLEMQRQAMLMYTSCGWFFDEISGIETIQIMRHAARAMQLAKEISGIDFEPKYTKILEEAPSNNPRFKNGAQIYELLAKPAIVDLLRVGIHYSLSSLFEEYPETAKIYCYQAQKQIYHSLEAGKQKLVVGKVKINSEITWEEDIITFAVLYLGNHYLNGRAQQDMKSEQFSTMYQEIKNAFIKSDVSEIIHIMDRYFGTINYSLWHLFKDEQRKVLNNILASTLQEIEFSFRQIYEHHYPIMQLMKDIETALPKALYSAVEFIIYTDIKRILESEKMDLDTLQKLVEEAQKWSLELDKTTLSFVASNKINILMEEFSKKPQDLSLLENIEKLLQILSSLPLELNLWKAQNIYFSISKQLCIKMQEKAKQSDKIAPKWLSHFNTIGSYLKVNCV